MKKGETPACAKGSPPPPAISAPLRLYGGRFCPHAYRVKLILDAKKLDYEVVNIDLRNKPEWFFERNVSGKVPLLEIKEANGASTFLPESVIIAEYLDDTYHDVVPLLPKDDPLRRAKQKVLTQLIYNKIEPPWGPVVRKGDEDKKSELVKGLREVETLLASDYFAGDELGFVDLQVWPWFERLPAVDLLRNVGFTDAEYPKLTRWTERMRAHPAIRDNVVPTEFQLQFLQTRDPNIGLP